MKFSVSIPYYQNLSEIKEALGTLLSERLINDIIITHDCSNDYKEIFKLSKHKKIRLYKNVKNWHILHNKRNAIYHAKNNWVICLDSDNKIDSNYIRTLNEYELDKDIIYAPEFAKPQFDYRCFSDKVLHKSTISEFSNNGAFMAFLNTFNYCINRDEYLKVYRYTTECHSSDSIYFNYLWLKSGRSIYVVPELKYEHRVHQNSTFIKEYGQSIKMARIYLNKINEL